MELSIIMPCLNEAETLGTCIRKAQDGARRAGVRDYEIIIVDNGSTDGSQGIARDAGARLLSAQARGYGAALMAGIEEARGLYVLMGDADDSYDFGNVKAFVDRLRQGDDLVMGNRFRGGIRPGAMPFLHQYLGNPVLSFLGRVFFRSRVGDFHCGLRGFRRESILGLGLRTTGMEYASEMIVKASLRNLRVTEVPTVLYPAGRSRKPHLRTWRDGWRHLRFLLLYSPRWLFLYPGILAAVVGAGGSVILLAGPFRIGQMTLDIGTLLYTMLLMVVGVQSMVFAVFTKVLGITQGFLRPDQTFMELLKHVTLETGLLVGGACMVFGTLASVLALGYWQQHLFGALNPSISLRFIIPGATLFTLGFQIALASFFLSILGLERK